MQLWVTSWVCGGGMGGGDGGGGRSGGGGGSSHQRLACGVLDHQRSLVEFDAKRRPGTATTGSQQLQRYHHNSSNEITTNKRVTTTTTTRSRQHQRRRGAPIPISANISANTSANISANISADISAHLPARIASFAPIRVNIRSTGDREHSTAGTQQPSCATRTVRHAWCNYDLIMMYLIMM